MILMFVTMNQQGAYRPLCCRIANLEAAFDALNAIVATGDRVVSADIIENRQRTPLPTDAFDGQQMSEHIKKLESEWQALLT